MSDTWYALHCRALKKTGVDPDAVNYINAHATSTPAGDLAEYRAIKQSFPGKHVRMNATKSMTGHLLGGAGAIEAIACIEAIRTGAPQVFLEIAIDFEPLFLPMVALLTVPLVR